MMKIFAVLATSIALVACATTPPVFSTVTIFDELPEANSDHRAIVLPVAHQDGSLEFRSYARVVEARLEEQGFRLASTLEDADLAVFIDYGIGEPQRATVTYPIFGQTGGGTTYQSGSISTPSGGATYSGTTYTPATFGQTGTGAYTAVTYDRFFMLDIVNLAASDAENMVRVYEARVESTGRSSTFLQVSNCLIDAVFSEFRGTKVRRVTGDACMLSGEE